MTPQQPEQTPPVGKKAEPRPLSASERLGWDPTARGVEIVGRIPHHRAGYRVNH